MDDNKILGSYLAEFNEAEPLRRAAQAPRFTSTFAGLSAAEYRGGRPYIKLVDSAGRTSWAEAERVPVRSLRDDLNVLGMKAGAGTTFDANLVSAFKRYAQAFKVAADSVEKDPESATGSIALVERIAYGQLKTYAARARARAAVGAGKKPAVSTPIPTGGLVSVSVGELQRILKTLGADPRGLGDGKFGPSTKSKWAASANKRKLNPVAEGRTGGTTAKVHPKTLGALRAAAAAKKPAAAPAPAPQPTAPSAPAPTPAPASGRMAANTHDIQSVLKRLGYPSARLSDGKFGPTTQGAWQESAKKRGLDPFIALKVRGDLTQVMVSEGTYYRLRADADAKVPPAPAAAPEPAGGRLTDLPPDQVLKVTALELNKLLAAFVPEPGKSTTGELYLKIAKSLNLDPRIEAAQDGALVLKATWTKLAALAAEKEATPKPLPPGPEKDEHAARVQSVIKSSTGKIDANRLRKAYNLAVQYGQYKGEQVPEKGGWTSKIRPALLVVIKPTNALWTRAWNEALVKGKLVTKDGKTVKLPPRVVSDIDKMLKMVGAEQKKATTKALKDYTEVNPADLIQKINQLSVTSKKFDRAGGSKELADAVMTFLQNTNTPVPKGDIVRVDKNKTYLKNDVLKKLAEAAVAAQKRADATKKLRASIVENALKTASGKVSVREFQEAIRATVLSNKPLSDREKKIYTKVEINGAFDAATRAAFTEVARTPTIGNAFQELQALMKKQLGPNFKTEMATEARNQIWNSYLDKAVKKETGKLVVQTLPTIAKSISANAALYRKTTAQDVKYDEQLQAQQRELKKAIDKSKAILAMVHVQQGLKQLVPKVKGLQITGTSDAGTREGLFKFSGLVFPEGFLIPDTLWLSYLKAVGIQVDQSGKPRRTWKGANYISLPPALANKLAEAASDWIAKNGPSPVQVVSFTNPSIVQVKLKSAAKITTFDEEAELRAQQAEQKAKIAEVRAQAAEAAARAAATLQDEKARAEAEARMAQLRAEANQAKAEAAARIQEAESRAAEAEASAQQAAAAAAMPEEAGAPMPMLPPSSTSSEESSQVAPEQSASQDVDVTVNLPESAAPAPVQAGMGGGMLWILALLGGGALLAMRGKGEEEKGKMSNSQRRSQPVRR